MKPPVEAPASRQRRPATIDLAERVERADQLVRAAGGPLPLGRCRDHVTGVSRSTTVAGLSGGDAAYGDPALLDQLRGLPPGAGQAAAHQLGIQPGPGDHGRHASPRGERLTERGVHPLERRDVLGEGPLGQPLDDPPSPRRRPRAGSAPGTGSVMSAR